MGNARGLGGSFPGSTLSFLKVTEMIKEIKAFPLENRPKKMRHCGQVKEEHAEVCKGCRCGSPTLFQTIAKHQS